MQMRKLSAQYIGVSLVALSLLTGCGGGGGGGEDDGDSTPSVTAPPHGTASLILSEAAAPEIAAQTVAVLASLRALGFGLANDLESVSPAHPVEAGTCGGGGSWSQTYIDVDNDGARSTGDRIEFEAPGCAVMAFGNGAATATVLEASNDELVDVRIVVSGGTLPYLAGWNWLPVVSGTLRMTADAGELWLRSEGAFVFSAEPQKSFAASNLGLRLRYDLTDDPPRPGIIGSLDIAFDTAAGAGGNVAVDMTRLFAGHAPNEPPPSGFIALTGANGSRVRISDAEPVSPGWFLIGTDANGDGIEEGSTSVSFQTIFDGL